MHLLAPFILQNSEKGLRANPELQGCAIFEPKMSIRPEQFFLVQTIIITFIYHYYYFHHLPFHCAKFKKKLLRWIQSYVDAPFLGPKWSICHKQIFFLEKIINILFIYQQVPFIKQNFQKSFAVDPEL